MAQADHPLHVNWLHWMAMAKDGNVAETGKLDRFPPHRCHQRMPVGPERTRDLARTYGLVRPAGSGQGQDHRADLDSARMGGWRDFNAVGHGHGGWRSPRQPARWVRHGRQHKNVHDNDKLGVASAQRCHRRTFLGNIGPSSGSPGHRTQTQRRRSTSRGGGIPRGPAREMAPGTGHQGRRKDDVHQGAVCGAVIRRRAAT